MFTSIAVVLTGVWLILLGSKSHPSMTLTLIFGIVIAVLAILDLVLYGRPYVRRGPPA